MGPSVTGWASAPGTDTLAVWIRPSPMANSLLICRTMGSPRSLPCSHSARSEASSAHTATLAWGHLLDVWSHGFNADGTDETQACKGDTGPLQLFTVEPRATLGSRELSQHPAIPRDPRSQQGLFPTWPPPSSLCSWHSELAEGLAVGARLRVPLTSWPL